MWSNLKRITRRLTSLASPPPRKPGTSRAPKRAASPSPQHSASPFPGPHEKAVEYDVARFGLPDFEYEPVRNGAPDPGEVVWTWVPFDENDGRRKDRPVLVVADTEEHVIFAQMTSKDKTPAASREAKHGRYWMDIGTGGWDPRRRPSEVRLDRLLVAHGSQIRREGSYVRKDIFDDVVRAIKNVHS
ncbi:PemK-like protein [Trueperella bialowiezensis]|uniref:PemK-like protein n=2 Tax=Trueperella bialowiezensis TaxID=312285 RepID=A0A3S4VBW8_9ACTO|nr:PemK-like protein [Trueperella bialowiezensis]